MQGLLVKEIEHDPQSFEEVRSGDSQAFRALVDRHGEMLYRLVVRMVGNREEAEDIAQEAFFRAYKTIASYKNEAHFVWSLRRIGSNLAIDLIRRRGRWKSRDIEAGEPIAAKDGDPDRDLRSRKIHEAVTGALDQLTAKERVAFVLRHYEGMSMKEISETTGINVNSTKNQVFRAVRKLREVLAPLAQELS